MIVAASVDANRILADEERLILAARCFFIHQRAINRLGIPVVRYVAIRPRIPNWEIKVR